MNLADVMGALATQLDTISGLRCFGYPPQNVTPPAAIVSYPADYKFDATYARGMDSLTIPVVVVVGKVSDRMTRELLGAYCDGSGSSSVKEVLEAGTYTAFDTIRVTQAEFDVVTISSTDYMAATFEVDVTGTGN